MTSVLARERGHDGAAIPSLLDAGASAGGWKPPPTSWQRLRTDPLFVRARQVFGPAVAVLALQFVAFPIPPGVYAYGVVLGALGALVAVGMALTWRANRIINFAQGQLGVVPAVVSACLLIFRGVSIPVAFAVGLVSAVVLGAAVDLIAIRRFSRSSRLVLTVATIGLSQLLSAAALGVPALWGRTAVDVTTGNVDLPLDWRITLDPIVLSDDHVVAVLVALAGLVGTSLFLRRTPAGVAVRAAAERSERAGMLGIPVARLEALVWVLAAVLSFLGVFFRTAVVGLPLSNPFVGFGTALGAVAALMLGRMDDLPSVTASAIALGVLEQAVTWNHGDTPELVYPVYAVVVILALAFRRFDSLRGAQDDVSSWQAADTVRDVPRVLRRLPEVRLARAALAAGFVGAAALLPAVMGPGDELKAAVVVVWAIVGLSVVVLTGWAGQVSLGQMAFAGYGAGFGALAFLDLGWDAMLVLPVAGLVGAAIAVVVGLPALRVRGVFLAAITLAFSVGSSSFLLSQRHTDWIPRGRIESISLFGFTLGTPRDTYWLALAVAALLFAATAGIRRSRTGRVLLALRENELAARSHGISVTRAKLTGFALSGALASIAGCLYVIAVFGYSESLFTPTDSFVVFTSTVVGGAGSMIGALAGAFFARAGTWLLSGTWVYVPSAVGVIVVLWVLPGGLAGLLYRGRDRALRAVAARRGLHVPVLAGPEALAERPLDAPVPVPDGGGGGLAGRARRAGRLDWRTPPPLPPAAAAPAVAAPAPPEARPAGPPASPAPPPGGPGRPTRPGPAVLACRGLDVAYGDVQVLYGVSLDVHAGEVVALLGTNGAGKSTLLKAISGVLAPAAGTIELAGRSIAGDAAHAVAARGVVQMPGGHGVFPGLTVDENLRMACWLERRTSRRARHGIAPPGGQGGPGAAPAPAGTPVVPGRDAPLDERIDAVLATFPVLGPRLATRAGDLSGGQQQMLSLGMALLARPTVLLVDELSLGLAPTVVARLLDVVRAVAAQGTAVVLVEQSVDVALRVADRAAFMEKGRVRFDGPAADLLGRPDLLRSVFLEGASAGLGAPDDEAGSGPAATGAPTVAALAALPRARTVAPRFEMRGITVSFGGIRAVDDVTVTVEPGEVVGFIGPNGAGKTTLLDVVSGVTPADRGLVLVDGVDVAGAGADERSRLGLARSFQDARLYPGLSVEQVLAVALDRWVPVTDPFRAAARTPAERAAERAVAERTDELLDLLGLDRYRDALTSELSTGTRRIVDLACVLAHHPTLVLLDEPSSGIAQRESEALGPLLRRVRDVLGCSMLVVEHDMALLSGLADRLVALDQGRVVADGPPAEVLRDPRVVSAYLGGPVVEGVTAATPAVTPSPAGPPPPAEPAAAATAVPPPPARPRPVRAGDHRNRRPHHRRARTFAVPILTVTAVLAYAVAGGLGRAPSDAEADRPTPAERLGIGEVGSHAAEVPLTWQHADAAQRAATQWVANCDEETGRIEVPSVYAPPCVPAFDPAAGGNGGNGGATWGGVTADTIRVAIYQGGAGDLRTALTRTLDTQEQQDETTDRLAMMLDDLAETYGRHVELVRFEASGGMDDEVAARADAIRLADEVAPFAVIGGPPLTTVFAEELAVRGIVCIDCGLATPDSFHQENAPFIWGPLPTPEEFLTILGDYLFNRVMGDPARFAGDPDLRGEERVLGVVRFEQRIPVFSDLARLVTMISDANGVVPAANEVYTFDLDKMPERATTIVARMKAAGVTTVLFLGDPLMPIYLTQAATAQDYFPEWLVSGTVLTDSTVMGRQYDQRQWAHAFGLSVLPAKTPVDQLEAYRLHQWYFGEAPAARGTAQLILNDLVMLFVGIHMAGPDLRPETFRDGMFGFPASGGGPTTPRISFGDNRLFIAEDLGTRTDYLAADDMTEVWWDADAVGPDEVGNEGRGMWRYANGGRRYLPNDMPEQDTDAFREEGSVLLYEDIPAEDRPPNYPSPRR